MAANIIETMLSLPSLRPGADFFEGESPSVIVLDLLLNQRVGVERATAVNLALHCNFAAQHPVLTGTLASATLWPSSTKKSTR